MEAKIVIHGKEYPIITEPEFTLGEAAEAERITGQGYDMDEGGALWLLATLFVSIRRVDPTVKLEDLEILTGDEVSFLKPPKGDAVVPPSTNVEPNGNENEPNENDGSTSNDSEPASEDSPEPILEPSGTPV